MKLRTKHRGFTLIELLIVVAIIAILAAIAVPNFLEAQTRSKIARVKADMRTLATAIESYATDWNRAPIGANEGYQLGIYGDLTRNIECYVPMTTPIAYITTIPKDPFQKMGFIKGDGTKSFISTFDYNYNMSLPPVSHTRQTYIDAAKLGYMWAMVSPGPSATKGAPSAWAMFSYPISQNPAHAPNSCYDATNGTTSAGWIIITNQGFYDGAGCANQ